MHRPSPSLIAPDAQSRRQTPPRLSRPPSYPNLRVRTDTPMRTASPPPLSSASSSASHRPALGPLDLASSATPTSAAHHRRASAASSRAPMTPPLTPSSSFSKDGDGPGSAPPRTPPSAGSSPLAHLARRLFTGAKLGAGLPGADGGHVSPGSPRGGPVVSLAQAFEHGLQLHVQPNGPPHSSRFLQLSGVPAETTPHDIRNLLATWGEVKAFLPRFQAERGIVFVIFFDLRHATIAYNAIQKGAAALPAGSGDGIVRLSADLVSIEDMEQWIGKTQAVAEADGRMTVSVGGVAVNCAGLEKILSSFGALKTFKQSGTQTFSIEYYDIRHAACAVRQLDQRVMLGARLSVRFDSMPSTADHATTAAVGVAAVSDDTTPRKTVQESSASELSQAQLYSTAPITRPRSRSVDALGATAPTSYASAATAHIATPRTVAAPSFSDAPIVESPVQSATLSLSPSQAPAPATHSIDSGYIIHTSSPFAEPPSQQQPQQPQQHWGYSQPPGLGLQFAPQGGIASQDWPHYLAGASAARDSFAAYGYAPGAYAPFDGAPRYGLEYAHAHARYGAPQPSPPYYPYMGYFASPQDYHGQHAHAGSLGDAAPHAPAPAAYAPAGASVSPTSPSGLVGADAPADAAPLRKAPVLPGVPERNQLDLERVEAGLDTRTTVMIKNIPNKMTDKDLLRYIDAVVPRRIDFCYLRMDFANGCNVGYAFVNFITVLDLLQFAQAKLGVKWNMYSSEKVLQMSYANYQGKEALVEKFKNSCIMDEREEWRPKIFYSSGPNQGLEEPFPTPTHLRRKERGAHNRGQLYVHAPRGPLHQGQPPRGDVHRAPFRRPANAP